VPTIDTSKVKVGHGFLWTAPASTARPADTLAELADPPSPWTFVGPTEEGVTQNVATETSDIRVEEVSLPVQINTTSKNFRLRTALSADTVESMKLAYGGGTITTVAAASGQPGKKVLKLSDTLDQLAAYFEVLNSAGFWRRIYVPKVLSLADVETRYRRSAANRAYPIELRAICLPEEIEIHEKTAAALA
jgi:hypothetical protein